MDHCKKVSLGIFLFYSDVYCTSIWGVVLNCAGIAHNLLRVHERIVKILFHPFLSGNGGVFLACNELLELPGIHCLYAGLYMYKVVHSICDASLSNRIKLQFPDHNFNTRGNGLYNLKFPRVNAIGRNLEFQFVEIWNSLPVAIKNAHSVKMLRRSLTRYFLHNCRYLRFSILPDGLLAVKGLFEPILYSFFHNIL